MIQANELRIGNWVEAVAPMGNYHMRIHAVNFESIERNPDCVNPIRLTHDILESAGFEYSKGQITGVVHYTKGNIKLINKEGAYDFASFPQTTIKYLHHLQNVYYDLTGNELEIKL